MSYYAKVVNGIVTQVIVAEASFFDTFKDPTPGEWLETRMDGSLRKNYAGPGYSYDAQRDAFIPPKPFPSWSLNEETCLWEAPVPYPQDGNFYRWVESLQAWVDPRAS